jgi:hypothetical protein
MDLAGLGRRRVMRIHQLDRCLALIPCQEPGGCTMFQTSTETVRKRLRRRFEKLVLRLGNRLFTRADAEAARHGWQVVRRRGGLARTYRDPRFSAFVQCEACAGEGVTAAREPCQHCNGHGRRVLKGFVDPTGGW